MRFGSLGVSELLSKGVPVVLRGFIGKLLEANAKFSEGQAYFFALLLSRSQLLSDQIRFNGQLVNLALGFTSLLLLAFNEFFCSDQGFGQVLILLSSHGQSLANPAFFILSFFQLIKRLFEG